MRERVRLNRSVDNPQPKRERVRLERKGERKGQQVAAASLANLKPFEKGNKVGRKPGVPNKVGQTIKEATLLAAADIGEDGKGQGGLRGYLKWLAAKHPQSFAGLLNKILPMQITANLNIVNLDVEAIRKLPDSKLALLMEVLSMFGLDKDMAQPMIDITPGAPHRQLASPSTYGQAIGYVNNAER